MSEPKSRPNEGTFTHPAPPDDEFDLQLMSVDPNGERDIYDEMAFNELDESIMAIDDVNPEELSSWLEEELDEDEAEFFEASEHEEPRSESNQDSRNQRNVGDEKYHDDYTNNYEAQYQRINGNSMETNHLSGNSTSLNPMYTTETMAAGTHNPKSHYTGNDGNFQAQLYNDALSNLALSMRRTELSRAQILRQSQTMHHVPSSVPHSNFQPSTIGSLTGLLTGTRSTLTAGLEQSRRQLREYMSRMGHQAF